jgi:hypothetical protein
MAGSANQILRALVTLEQPQMQSRMDRGFSQSTHRHLRPPRTMVGFFFLVGNDVFVEIYGVVSRHISNMTLTAAPTFPQTQYYNDQRSTYPQGNPPPYSEYDQQIRYLASSNAPADDSGYWENTRNDAVRMLNEQAGPYVLNTRI